jgi:PST family polysaccharide transporter
MGWLAGERLFAIVIGGGLSIVTVRYLGPDRLGTYSFALSIVLLVASFTQLNSNLFVRELILAPSRENVILGSAAALSAILVIAAEGVLLVVGYTLIPASQPTTRALLGVFAIGLLFGPIMVLDFAFQAHLRAKQATFARNCGLATIAIGSLAVVVTDGGVVALAGTTLLGPLVTAVLFVFFYTRDGKDIRRWHPAVVTMTRLARATAPLTVSAVAITLYMRVDQIMLGWLSTREQVGLYAATVRLSEFVYFIPMIAVASFGPSIAATRSLNFEAYREALARIFVFLSIIATTVIVITELIGGKLAVLLYGGEYSAVGDVLSIHILACIFVFFGVAEMLWVVNESLQKIMMYKTIAGAVVNVGLNLVLLPRFGAIGAAWSTLIAYAVAATLGDLVHPGTRPLFVMEMQSLNPVRVVGVIRDTFARETP